MVMVALRLGSDVRLNRNRMFKASYVGQGRLVAIRVRSVAGYFYARISGL